MRIPTQLHFLSGVGKDVSGGVKSLELTSYVSLGAGAPSFESCLRYRNFQRCGV